MTTERATGTFHVKLVPLDPLAPARAARPSADRQAGTMDRGQPRLSVNVVPDSGTGELAGLSGTFSIRIEGGQHFYEFDYVFQATT